MRWLRYLAILVVLAVLEVSLPPLLRPFGAGPDLLLCFALALALHGESWKVLGPLWGIGLARDVLGLGPFGLHAFLLAAAGMLVFVLRESLFRHHRLTLVVLGGVASLLLGLAALLRLALAGTGPAAAPALLRILAAALLTGAVAPLVVRSLLRGGLLLGFVPLREMEARA